jgi:NitT/TauT family transport system substrate-binding protein
MLAGRIDFHMGGDKLQAFNQVAQDIPVVAVAAIFQKHPQVILAHPGEAESWEELKELDTLLIGDNGFVSYYQWMISAHGFTAEQREPYTFNPAPFVADPRKGMQGYLSSEPYAVEKETGWAPNVFLIADAGYSSYRRRSTKPPRWWSASSTARSRAGTTTSTATVRPPTR